MQAISPIATHFSAAWSVCLSVCRLSHLSTLFKLFDRFTCRFAAPHLQGFNDTYIVVDGVFDLQKKERFEESSS